MARFKEQKAWDGLSAGSEGRLKMYRIENAVGTGMPDVIGENRKATAFWLELKSLHEWPKRASTCPLKGHFEKGQIGWARDWRSWGGNSFVLLKVEQEWYLLTPHKEIERMDKEQIMRLCLVCGDTKESVITFLEEL